MVGRRGDTGPESESARQLLDSTTQYKTYKLNEAPSERHAIVTVFATMKVAKSAPDSHVGKKNDH
jgi:hypothetical protein